MKISPLQWIGIGFSGLLFLVGIILCFETFTADPPIKTIFFCALSLMVISLFGPQTIKKFKFGISNGIEIERKFPEEKKPILFEYAQKDASTKPREEAIELVKEAAELPESKRSAEDYLVLATESWRAKKYDEALDFTYAGLHLNPSDIRTKATSIHRLGSIYDYLGNKDLGIKYYEEALKIDPTFSWPHINLGNLYRDQKKYDEAEKEYKETIRLDPDNADALSNLGVLYYDQNKFDDAEEKYKEAILLNPNIAEIHFNLGNIFSDQKKYDDAEREYLEGLRLDPNKANFHNNLGFLYQNQRKYHEAEKHYKEALRLDPEHVKAKSNLEMIRELKEKGG